MRLRHYSFGRGEMPKKRSTGWLRNKLVRYAVAVRILSWYPVQKARLVWDMAAICADLRSAIRLIAQAIPKDLSLNYDPGVRAGI